MRRHYRRTDAHLARFRNTLTTNVASADRDSHTFLLPQSAGAMVPTNNLHFRPQPESVGLLVPPGFEALIANASPKLLRSLKADGSNADVTDARGFMQAGGTDSFLPRPPKGGSRSRVGGAEEDIADDESSVARLECGSRYGTAGYDQLPSGPHGDGRLVGDLPREDDVMGPESQDQADMPLAPVSATLQEIIGGRRYRSRAEHDRSTV
jgi:hypothetical protein